MSLNCIMHYFPFCRVCQGKFDVAMCGWEELSRDAGSRGNASAWVDSRSRIRHCRILTIVARESSLHPAGAEKALSVMLVGYVSDQRCVALPVVLLEFVDNRGSVVAPSPASGP